MQHIAVVGASLAGLRAVEALRRRGYAGALTLIGDEPRRPYDRPPLSKQVLAGDWPEDRVFFRQKEGYEALDLDLRLGVRATGLDGVARSLHLSDGSALSYGGLVIATGARARELPNPQGLSGVHVLRSLEDSLRLRDELPSARRVAIVGAGFIGLEVASVCRAKGLAVTAIEMAPVPLARILGEPVARAVVGLHEAEGVQFRNGVSVTGLEGEGRVQAVLLSDGSQVETDLVVVGIGVVPNTEWLAGSGVALSNGVVCDARCATALPQVVAAGDVARFFNPRFGIDQRIEHWTHAVEMANAAAQCLLDGAAAPEFAPVPYFWSDQYDVKIQFAGQVQPEDEVRVLEGSLTDRSERKLVVAYGRAGQLTGALTWNRPPRLIQLRRAIGQETKLADL